MLVSGEPGVGKTRLTSEAARAAHGQGAIVLFGRCDEELGCPVPAVPRGHQLRTSRRVPRSCSSSRSVRSSASSPASFPRSPTASACLPSRCVPIRRPSASGCSRRSARSWRRSPSRRRSSSCSTICTGRRSRRCCCCVTSFDSAHGRRAPPRRDLPRHRSRSWPSAVEVLADLRREPGVDRIALHGLDQDGVAEFLRVCRGSRSRRRRVATRGDRARGDGGQPVLRRSGAAPPRRVGFDRERGRTMGSCRRGDRHSRGCARGHREAPLAAPTRDQRHPRSRVRDRTRVRRAPARRGHRSTARRGARRDRGGRGRGISPCRTPIDRAAPRSLTRWSDRRCTTRSPRPVACACTEASRARSNDEPRTATCGSTSSPSTSARLPRSATWKVRSGGRRRRRKTRWPVSPTRKPRTTTSARSFALDPEVAAQREKGCELRRRARPIVARRRRTRDVEGRRARGRGRRTCMLAPRSLADAALVIGGDRGWGEAGVVDEELVALLEEALEVLPPGGLGRCAPARRPGSPPSSTSSSRRPSGGTRSPRTRWRWRAASTTPRRSPFVLSCAIWGSWVPGNVAERLAMARRDPRARARRWESRSRAPHPHLVDQLPRRTR